MASGRKKWVLGGASVALVALVALVVALPTLAARGLEARATKALEGRELDATWSALEVGWRGQLSIRDLEARDPARGIALEVDHLEVVPTLSSLFDGEPRLRTVQIRGARARVDLERLRRRLEREGGGARAPAEGGAMARLRRAFEQSPPTIRAEGVTLQLHHGGHELFEFSGVSGTLARDAQGMWEGEAIGAAALTHERLPSLLRNSYDWKIRCELDEAHARVWFEPAAGEALAHLEVPRLGAARVGVLSVELDRKRRRVRALARRARVRLGRAQAPVVQVEAPVAELELGGEQPRLYARGATLEVAPTRVDQLGGARARLGALLERAERAARPSPAAAGASQEQAWARARRWGGQVSQWMTRVDAELEQSVLVVHLPLGPGRLRRIELVRGLDVELERGRLRARGAAAGGSFGAGAQFMPGQALPVGASLEARGVDISKLPGVAQGRTLPNRGVRGRVGGVVDLSAHLALPPRGIDGARGLDEVTLMGAARWRDGSVYLHGLADEPLQGLDLGGEGTLRWWPGMGQVRLEGGRLVYNDVEVGVEASLVDWPLEPELKLEASMAETSCQAMVDALPDALLGPYRNVELEGRAAPRLRVEWEIEEPRTFEIEIDGLAEEDDPELIRARRRQGLEPMLPVEKTHLCRVENLRADQDEGGWPEVTIAEEPGSPGQAPPKASPPAWRNPNALGDVYWLNRPFVMQVTEGVSEEAEVYVGPGLESYVPLSELPPWVAGAAYLSEEILFYYNRGVSVGLLQKALRIDLEKGRFVYGGSTVTQQLVKNLFLTRDKTLARKLQEALISFRVDEVVSKDRVIELYLNCIEFGPDLYGIGPAAQHYFGKDARELTPVEAVFLGVIKPSPSYGDHLRKRGGLPTRGWFPQRIETIFDRMVEYEVMTREQAEAARPYTLRWEDGVYAPHEPEVREELELELLELFEDE